MRRDSRRETCTGLLSRGRSGRRGTVDSLFAGDSSCCVSMHAVVSAMAAMRYGNAAGIAPGLDCIVDMFGWRPAAATVWPPSVGAPVMLHSLRPVCDRLGRSGEMAAACNPKKVL